MTSWIFLNLEVAESVPNLSQLHLTLLISHQHSFEPSHRIDAQAQLTIDHVGWEEYWLPVKLMSQTDELLKNFEAVWSVYIDGGFPAAMRREYCLRYFQLLDAVIDCWLTDPTKEIGSVALRQVVGFESFIIYIVSRHGRRGCRGSDFHRTESSVSTD